MTADPGLTPGVHRGYWHPVLEADYCVECGDEFPCLPYRQANPGCLCSHSRSQHGRSGSRRCFLRACGCTRFRPKDAS